MASFFERLGRRKIVQLEKSELNRVLSTLDLTALGIGSTIGVGIYVLAGQVARGTTGPAVTISFLIAAVASLFAGLCYAEFGARVPKAGSAYVYAYVCIGEFVAFIIGWNLILEYVIGTASVASGYSRYIDDLTNNTIRKALTEAMPMDSSFLSPFPDFLAFGLAAVLSIGLALGVRESSRANNLFTGINIIVICFVIIAAGTQADLYNWKIPANELDAECEGSDLPDGKEDWGSGGFSPWGFQGIMEGAAICFFGFVGFDVIATTGEETLNPSRTIPISIGISLTVVFLSYFGVAAVITLVVPYCQQDEGAPLVDLFDDENIGWVAAKWFVTVGALFGFSASLFGALFPLPRVLYAMASDGLLFRQLSQISKRFQTPTLATVIAGLSAGFMAMLFDLEALVSMMSIGTLMAYSIVALCVMLLRFKDEDGSDSQGLTESGLNQISTRQSSYSASDYFNQLFNQKGLKKPTDLSSSLVSYVILLFCVMVVLLDILLVVLVKPLMAGEGGAVAGVCILLAINLLLVFIIARQPESQKKLSFKVPFVPWLPALSTVINTYLMCNLSPDTWVRFAVWMFIGFLIYFGYGIRNSSEGKRATSKYGQNNLGFTGDEDKDQNLVIPTIHVQPATPMSSQPNTPNLKAKTHEPPIPPSPLAAKETVTGQSDASNPKSTHGPDPESEAAPLGVTAVVAPLGAVAVVSSLMDKKNDSKESSRSRSEEKGEGIVPAHSDTGNNDEVQSSPERKKSDKDSASGETPDSLPLIAGVSVLAAKVSQDDEKKDEEKSREDSMKASCSAPDLPPSLPPQQPSIFRVKSDGVLNRSVPTTPVVGRHPVKVLRRMSSFDDIPPSSPDSPLARHIGNKFVIIPVKEPGLDSNDSSSQVSPSFTPRVIKKGSGQKAAGSQEDLMNKVLYKLKDIPDGSQKEEEKSQKMFTVGSSESLDSISSETDANGLGVEQPGQKKMVNRESKLDVLDTIRERGESKIYSGDGDKTDIHTSPENSDKPNIIDKVS